MTDYLREVEESMRAEKWARLWQENSTAILLFCVAIVVGTAAQTAWTGYKHSRQEEATTNYLNAVKLEDPLPELQKLATSDKTQDAALVNMTTANLLLRKEDWAGTIAAYKKVADDKSAPPMLRDLATVQMVAIQMDHAQEKPEAMLATLKPVADNAKSAWQARAKILTALITGDKLGQYKDAAAMLDKMLADTTLPASVMAQISALHDVYQIKGQSK